MARIYDRGLQPERTALAWRRTAISWWAVTALAVTRAVERHDLALGALAAVLLVGCAVVGVLSAGRHRALSTPGPRLDYGRVRLLAVLGVLAAVVALGLVV